MKKIFFSLLYILLVSNAFAQTNLIITNVKADQAIKGLHDPATYFPSTIINHPDSLARGINKDVSADSLKDYIEILGTFENRNTCSDTVSETRGIGAARRWVYKKFQQFSASHENRLIPAYFQFDQSYCSFNQFRNIMAVLPGMDTTDKSIIIIEGHIDSRCEGLNDTACLAQGIEDNASGTALVIELARVMSKYAYNHTLVFLVTVGEEQGLYGAEAFADYALAQGIKIKAVQNNDVIGGVICGETSSAPSCSPAGSIDSLNVRMFSFGTFNSPHKQLARFIKLQYNEMIKPIASVPMTIRVMAPEDRTGRGGDHIPFRSHGYPAMRFTSANEHGNANVSDTSYSDHQHTSEDILGVDTNNDMVIDSFFVDFNYLARNTVINGNAAAMNAVGPKKPDFTVTTAGGNYFTVTITQQTQYSTYRAAVRTNKNDWDSLHVFNGLTHTFYAVPNSNTFIFSVASVDTNGVESMFSKEILINVTSVEEKAKQKDIILLQNSPNPFDEVTAISFYVNKMPEKKSAYISVADLKGNEVKRIPVEIQNGMNEILYEHGYGAVGSFVYSLYIGEKLVDAKKMVFAN